VKPEVSLPEVLSDKDFQHQPGGRAEPGGQCFKKAYSGGASLEDVSVVKVLFHLMQF